MNQDKNIRWSSLRYEDGSWYEGLIRIGKQHRSGVLVHANGDRYEGEFQDGKMEGYGAYVWANGTVYRGQWMQDIAHGCGVKIWKGHPADGLALQSQVQVQEGKFFGDEFVGPVMGCSVEASHAAAVEADVAAHLARNFLTEAGKKLRMKPLDPSHTSGRPESQAHQASGLLETSTAPNQHTSSSTTPQRKQEGWTWRWPWDTNAQHDSSISDQGSDVKSATAASSRRRAQNATISMKSSDSSQSNRIWSDSEEAFPDHEPSLSNLPKDHPARDPDVELRTRKLRYDEQAMARGVVDHYMARAAEEYYLQKGGTGRNEGGG